MRIAIDPGMSGAIAWQKISESANVAKMPDTASELADLLRGLVIEAGNEQVVCILEQVHSMPKQGVSSTFKFGMNYGMIQGVLSALGIPYFMVTPQSWQKKVGGMPSDKGDRKRALKAYSQNLYPNLKIGLQEADALAMLSVGGGVV